MAWENDPELYLHRPHFPLNSTIYTKRCLDMTKTIPLTDNDFIDAYPYRPTNFKQLVMSTTTWSQPDFQRLLDYISPNHYLVNCQGLVFLEVFPFDENEDIAASVPFYVRLFDVIDLTNFGFPTQPKKVPPRTIKYIVDGYDAQVDDPPVVVVVIPPVVVDPPVVDIEDGRPKFDPSWMTDNWESNWIDIYGLKKIGYEDGTTYEVTKATTRFGDDNTTNVGREYFHGLRRVYSTRPWPDGFMTVTTVAGLGDRFTQARFDPRVWGMFQNGRDWYPMRINDGRVYDFTTPTRGTEAGDPWPPTSN